MAKQKRKEDYIQMDICDHLDKFLTPNSIYFHIPNGSLRPSVIVNLKRMGLKNGIPDLCIINAGLAYFIEVKTDKGRLSENQKKVVDLLRKAGTPVEVCTSVSEVATVLKRWNLYEN